MYKGLHHVSLLVENLEQSRHFYESILLFEKSEQRPPFDFPGAWYNLGETQLHLIVHPEGKARRGTTMIDSRDGHFAVRVTDIKELRRRLQQQKIAFVEKGKNPTGWHQIFVSDPDGNIIEFNA